MPPMGAVILDKERQRISFRVFAHQKRVNLLLRQGRRQRILPMKQELPDVYSLTVEGRGRDLLYKFQVPGEGDFPDPYSGFQPEGVHGFSRVVDHRSFPWRDEGWGGIPQEELMIYELHVGTFTPGGSFGELGERLDYLQELGINTLEVMPVAETPGRWNWGYDGVFPFSVNHNYGSPDDFRLLVDRCHQRGLGVILDVVYNHLGPEGNYLPRFGPYFTDKHQTPWGAAVNYDDECSEYTRRLVLDNVTHWIRNYHLDGLRLDAVHAIRDDSRPHILQEIARTARDLEKELGRRLVIIAETDENQSRLINPASQGGYGIDAQWLDDFHHTIHTVMTGEDRGYYQDYGSIEGFEKVFRNYLYTGEYSRFWKKPRGSDGRANPGRQFVVATQTHDQVGNRAQGERLSHLVGFGRAKVAAGLVLLSAYLPMLFMGEEYAESHPFQFFSDFSGELARAVSAGRREEFSQFGWQEVPDPQDPGTFYRSKLTPPGEWDEQNRSMFRFYRDLIALRKTHPALREPDKDRLEARVHKSERVVELTRWSQEEKISAWFNLGDDEFPLPQEGRSGRVLLHSEWEAYGGKTAREADTLPPAAMVVYG
ncbi:MAG: malto-oligosyltrehalose trehalohydrolase [Firmicutes bacterium]|nr:malto-oligosyltrehalose trehalohydrolase [Bacillota bacterium]